MRSDWIAEQSKRLAKAQAHARGVRNASAAVLEPEELDIDGAIERFDSSVCELMTAQHLDRHRAIAIVAMKNPALHKAFLLATNPGARRGDYRRKVRYAARLGPLTKKRLRFGHLLGKTMNEFCLLGTPGATPPLVTVRNAFDAPDTQVTIRLQMSPNWIILATWI